MMSDVKLCMECEHLHEGMCHRREGPLSVARRELKGSWWTKKVPAPVPLIDRLRYEDSDICREAASRIEELEVTFGELIRREDAAREIELCFRMGINPEKWPDYIRALPATHEDDMTEPAEIAASLSPAQIRALRDPDGCEIEDALAVWGRDKAAGKRGWLTIPSTLDLTPLGRAVLAALDAKEST